MEFIDSRSPDIDVNGTDIKTEPDIDNSINTSIIKFKDSVITKNDFYIKHRNYLIVSIKNTQKIKDSQQAEDIVQDLYLAIQEKSKFDNFDNENHARRFCTGWCKMRLKEIMRVRRYEENTEISNLIVPDKKDYSHENDLIPINLIKSKFNILTVRQREMMELQFIDGHTPQEVSERLKIDVAAVSRRTTIAINKLREAFNLKPKTRRITKPVTQLSLSGKFIMEHESIHAAARKTGQHPGTISKACSKQTDTAGGYLWQYATRD